MEFYDSNMLQRVGRKIVWLRKIDAYTSATLRGRYARICVQVPMNNPLRSSVTIGTYNQLLQYEGKGFLCKSCGKIGHTKEQCSIEDVKTPEVSQSYESGKSSTTDEWTTISFNRQRKGPLK
ncbi:hypothetical protein T459_12010 [Capsicum annuum]|uniref:CCHC-type domain-containing protein n=1 Tax=Capsicum annuum TaxID=4072 RepID=A0A2G2ZNK6_CAPAN|nr:hypothetical protein T459_12010 [Capsicum annuum]